MLNNHDKEIISEITDFNTLTLVSAIYTVYEKLCTKKPISQKEFYNVFEKNYELFYELLYKESVE